MYDEDRKTALSMYNEMFCAAEDEERLARALVSPTKQAVILARAYNARERDLEVRATSGQGDADVDSDAKPRFVTAIEELTEKLEDRGILVYGLRDYYDEPEEENYPEEEYSEDFSGEEYQEENYGEEEEYEETPVRRFSGESAEKAAETEADPFAFPEFAAPDFAVADFAVPDFAMERGDALTGGNSEDEFPMDEFSTDNAPKDRSEACGVTADYDKSAEEQASAEPATTAAAGEITEESGNKFAFAPPENEDREARNSRINSMMESFNAEKTPAEPAPEPEKTTERPRLEGKRKTERPEKAENEEPERTHFARAVAADEDEEEQPEEINILLLVLYLVFAVPITAACVLILLVPAVLFLALSVVLVVLGFKAIMTAFGGFAVFADIMVVLGGALVIISLGLMAFWAFIWFICGAMVGIINGAIKLGGRFCTVGGKK